jgi:hypothetical protein
MVDCDEYLVVVTGEFRSGPQEPKFPATGSGWMQKFRKVRAQMSQKNWNALEEILYIYIIYIFKYYIYILNIYIYIIII